MNAFAEAKTNELATVVIRHDRKGGGSMSEAALGSIAFTGAADQLIQLRVRPPGAQRARPDRAGATRPRRQPLVGDLPRRGRHVLGC